MKNNKQYENKLHIPPINDNSIELLQDRYCDAANGCIRNCKKCLFDESNLPEFTKWFDEKFKAD